MQVGRKGKKSPVIPPPICDCLLTSDEIIPAGLTPPQFSGIEIVYYSPHLLGLRLWTLVFRFGKHSFANKFLQLLSHDYHVCLARREACLSIVGSEEKTAGVMGTFKAMQEPRSLGLLALHKSMCQRKTSPT